MEDAQNGTATRMESSRQRGDEPTLSSSNRPVGGAQLRGLPLRILVAGASFACDGPISIR